MVVHDNDVNIDEALGELLPTTFASHLSLFHNISSACREPFLSLHFEPSYSFTFLH